MPERSPSDGQLVRRVRNGSMAALGTLYERHGAMLFRTAYRFAGNREDAEEVVQDLFVGLRDALAGYVERGRFEAWARRIAVRLAIDRRRRGSRTDRIRAGAQPPLRPEAAPPGSLDAVALEAALAELPDPLREVFLLREAEGLSHEEIGEILGIRPGTSMVRLTRAKKKLRRMLR